MIPYLRKCNLDVHFNEDVIQNTVRRIWNEGECAHRVFDSPKEVKDISKVEYFLLFLYRFKNVLEGAVRYYKGAWNIDRNCEYFLFWDSMHNFTKYMYRFTSFTIVDSERRHWPFLFSLALSETADSCKQVLSCWFNPFIRRLSKIIIIDRDDSVHAGIIRIPYSIEIHLLPCAFHFLPEYWERKSCLSVKP